MKATELIKEFNDRYGITAWPLAYPVDAETYANCCQYVFNKSTHIAILGLKNNHKIISLGPSNGLLFKNVELLLEKK